MHFPHKFYRLPLNFDAKRLMHEVNQIDESEWILHPNKFPGNTALILISTFGEDNHDTHGAMQETPRLQKMPYMRQVMASFNTVVGRARLMKLAPQSAVNRHTDISLYWRHRMRLHIPLVTDPAVRFCCEEQEVHMGEGEAWTFDNWRYHQVFNDSDITRIHLVIDTVGSPELWHSLENNSFIPTQDNALISSNFKPQLIEYKESTEAELAIETYNLSSILPPADVDAIIDEFTDDLDEIPLGTEKTLIVINILKNIKRGWRALWSIHGDVEVSKNIFQAFLNDKIEELNLIHPPAKLKINDTIIGHGLNIQLGDTLRPKQHKSNKPGEKVVDSLFPTINTMAFKNPIFIVSNNIEHASLIYNLLIINRSLWSSPNFSLLLNILMEGSYVEENLTCFFDDLTKSLEHQENGLYEKLAETERPLSIRFLHFLEQDTDTLHFIKRIFPDMKLIIVGNKNDISTEGYSDIETYIVNPDAFENTKSNTLEELCLFCDIPFGPKMKQLSLEN